MQSGKVKYELQMFCYITDDRKFCRDFVSMEQLREKGKITQALGDKHI